MLRGVLQLGRLDRKVNFMVFVPKLDWQDSPSTTTPITAAQLIRIEQGVAEGARQASETQTGNVELATAAEMTTGTDLTRVPSVKRVVDYIASVVVSTGGVTLAQLNAAIAAPFSLISTAISMVPLKIKRMVGQTANLLEVKDENDVILAYIDQNGQICAGTSFAGQGMLKANGRSGSLPVMRLQMGSSPTGNAIVLQDSTGQAVFTVNNDGTLNAKNLGSPPGGGITYSPMLVLDASATVPTETVAGTIVLRRPA